MNIDSSRSICEKKSITKDSMTLLCTNCGNVRDINNFKISIKTKMDIPNNTLDFPIFDLDKIIKYTDICRLDDVGNNSKFLFTPVCEKCKMSMLFKVPD